MKTRFTLASASSATALALLLTPVAIAEDGVPTPEGATTGATNSDEDGAAGGNTTPAPQEGAEDEGTEQDSEKDATPAAPQVRDVELTISCKATPSKVAGVQHVGPEKAAFQLTAPGEVKAGEVFSLDLDLDPVAMDLPLPAGTFDSASRLKLDFALPAGVSFVGADIDESGANIKGLSAFTVNEQGYPDPTGRILRFASADNQTIGNSPNSSKSAEGGVTYKAGQNKLDLRFPKVSAKFRATTPGEKAFGVRTAGKAGQYGQDENFLTLLGKVSAPVVGTVWAPVQCAPLSDKAGPVDASAASLLTVNALPGDGEAALKYSSVDVQITGPNTGTVKERATYRVALTPNEGEAKDVNGMLTFTDNGRAVMNGEKLLQVPVVRGVAEADLSWLQSGKHTLEARFHPQRDDLSLVLGTGSIDVAVAAAPGENDKQDNNKKPNASSSEGSSAKGFFGGIKEIFEKIFGFFAEFFRSIFTL